MLSSRTLPLQESASHSSRDALLRTRPARRFLPRRGLANSCALVWLFHVQVQEGFGEIPGEAGGAGMIRGADVAKEGVVGLREFHVDVGFSQALTFIHDSANLVLPDMFILATPEK